MSLPPGFLDELRTRLSISQVVGAKVMWDTRKSNQGKGDMWAPCPFHQEKTASFHVDDRKGFYYCFGCHAKGDAISFVMETENLGFMEAVKVLAGEAGMQVPQADPQAQAKADRNDVLRDVMEQAVRWFRLQLKSGGAVAARDYLTGRGFDEAKTDRWELGFAPDRGGLLAALKDKGVPEADIIDAGLAAESDRGGGIYERFRGRIIYPIRDGRGRAIAFGGRAMSPDAQAKYLNSPQTSLFDKGRQLYNHAPAREAAGRGQPLIVAEGYMDVIALSEAGFAATVAPLGTAITEDQLRLMWRIAPEPVIALDGDKAGMGAAMRLVDLAMPMLEAGRSLRFAVLPEGQDPDDLIRAGGPAAMRKVIEAAMPMVDLLWRRETEGKDFDSPERKAGLDRSLREKLRLIRDPSIRAHYGDAIKELRRGLFRPALRIIPGGRGKGPRWQPPATPMPGTRASMLVAGEGVEDRLREGVILATLLSTPQVLPEFMHLLERMRCVAPENDRLRHALIAAETTPEEARALVEEALGPEALEDLFAQRHIAISPSIRRGGDADVARSCLEAEFATLAARRGVARELAEAEEDMAGDPDEGLTWRLKQAAAAFDAAGKTSDGEDSDYDTGPNGARISRGERSAFEELLGRIGLDRKPEDPS